MGTYSQRSRAYTYSSWAIRSFEAPSISKSWIASSCLLMAANPKSIATIVNAAGMGMVAPSLPLGNATLNFSTLCRDESDLRKRRALCLVWEAVQHLSELFVLHRKLGRQSPTKFCNFQVEFRHIVAR